MKKSKSLIFCFVAILTASLCAQALSLREELIQERIKPLGDVHIGEAPVLVQATNPDGSRTGESIYNTYCHTCHAVGISGAPKLGSAADWNPRIANGMDTMLNHAMNGFNAMPAKGLCMNCSEEEIKGTIEYMVSQVK